MSMYTMHECDENEWQEILPTLPDPHFLQSSEWARVKINSGWFATYKVWKSSDGSIVGGAMILEKQLNLRILPMKILIQYIPKGPLLNWNNYDLVENVLQDISDQSKNRKAIFTKMDPDIIIENQMISCSANSEIYYSEKISSQLIQAGWHFSEDQIQFQNTVWVDLEQDEEKILVNMKQKSRYNIRLAEKKGVKIRVAKVDEYPIIYNLYAETSIRDNFIIRSKNYYLELWKTFTEAGICEILVAEFEGLPIAGLVIYYFGTRAFYIYGMSSNKHRNLMSTYLIQWEAIKRAKQKGMKVYDLWGAPAKLEDTDPMWGVYRFKLGLGGSLIRTIGAWDFTSRKNLYILYQKILPKILNIFRFFGRMKTQQSID
ncbi:MAG: hypothetical protein CVU46_05725 [Chloroflexi bacterium HGW-Chloroflexi-8]|nr:MAG: hypothetical protein CVU46_05725 [Chloroflexi bacterium HGW-Chloroflexi-8]